LSADAASRRVRRGVSPDREASAPVSRPGRRWPGRPGRSLTRRLIWLASAWIVVALVLTGYVLTSQFQESALRRLSVLLSDTIVEIVVTTNATETGLTVDLVGDARSQRPLSGKYWAVATMTPSGRLNFVSRSGPLAGSDFSVPHDLTERLTAALGEVISYNDIGPRGEPLRVAASMKKLPGRTQPVVFIAAIDRSDIDADTRQFATLTWISLLVLGVGLAA